MAEPSAQPEGGSKKQGLRNKQNQTAGKEQCIVVITRPTESQVICNNCHAQVSSLTGTLGT